MNKLLAASSLLLAMSVGSAQASITLSNKTHDTSEPNSIETYYFTANAAGSSSIYLSSQGTPLFGTETFMDGLLSVWQLTGNLWTLVGANDNARRGASGTETVNDFGVPVHQLLPGDAYAGISDPGLNLNLVQDATYMIVQSDNRNGPKSLSNDQQLLGSLGQQIAVGSNVQNALWGKFEPWGEPTSGVLINTYNLTITGNVSLASPPAAVPLPGAIWLFGSMAAGLGWLGRKKTA